MQLEELQRTVAELKMQKHDGDVQQQTLEAVLGSTQALAAKTQLPLTGDPQEPLDLEDCAPIDMSFLPGWHGGLYLTNDAMRRMSYEEESLLKLAVYNLIVERLAQHEVDLQDAPAREALEFAMVQGAQLWVRGCGAVPACVALFMPHTVRKSARVLLIDSI